VPGYERQSGRGAKKEILFLNVSLVCPEPVLATCDFAPEIGKKKTAAVLSQGTSQLLAANNTYYAPAVRP